MIQRDYSREQRIETEIVVDAYGAAERATAWYCYLEAQIRFPFAAKCIVKRAASPLETLDEVEVTGMPSEDVCEREMFVRIRWANSWLAVPLAQLKPVTAAPHETIQAIADWHYWVRRGYEF